MSTITKQRLTLKRWLSDINIFRSENNEEVELSDELIKAQESADNTMNESNAPIKVETKKPSKKGGFSESIAQDKIPNVNGIKIPPKMQETYNKIHEER